MWQNTTSIESYYAIDWQIVVSLRSIFLIHYKTQGNSCSWQELECAIPKSLNWTPWPTRYRQNAWQGQHGIYARFWPKMITCKTGPPSMILPPMAGAKQPSINKKVGTKYFVLGKACQNTVAINIHCAIRQLFPMLKLLCKLTQAQIKFSLHEMLNIGSAFKSLVLVPMEFINLPLFPFPKLKNLGNLSNCHKVHFPIPLLAKVAILWSR